MEHLGYLFAAYSIIFAVIFLYVLFIWRRQAALDAELRSLEARMASLDQASVPADSTEPRSDI
ncbi:MAG: CcmD family protein [Candidatus Binatus sp.]|jgi:CcmD family protein|uniref:CcmD family protein n=1 Tax=Candidatus Binatus sp. TaxID=2811406 RepID=UPI003C746D66